MITFEIADFVIDNIRATAKDDKTAKQMLADYASSEFDVKLKKSQTFPNMLKTLEQELKKLKKAGAKINNKRDYSADPIGSGTFTKDLIEEDKYKTLGYNNDNGTQTIDAVNTKPIVESETVQDLQKDNSTSSVLSLHGADITSLVDSGHYQVNPQSLVTNGPIIKTLELRSEPYRLSASFVPKFSLLGAKPGYYTIQPEVSEWIANNPDWKNRPDDIGPKHADTLKTYIYYINKDGRIVLQEANNQKFISLK